MNNIYRLSRPPRPTFYDPHAQIKWMFYQVYSEQTVKSGKNATYAMGKYIKFISETDSYYNELAQDKRFFLSKYWEIDALVRFNRWLRQQQLASKTKYSLYKSVRSVLNMAYSLSVINEVIYNEPFDKGERETETNTAFETDVDLKISAAIDKWIYLSIRVLNGYTKTNNGIQTLAGKYKYKGGLSVGGIVYRSAKELAVAHNLKPSLVQNRLASGYSIEEAVKPNAKSNYDSGIAKSIIVENIEYPSVSKAEKAYKISGARHKLLKGYSVEEAFNLRPRYAKAGSIESALWLFEEKYDCNPRTMLEHVKSDINNSPFKVNDLLDYFNQWGVWYGVTRDLVMPLVIKLISLTGLNLESVKSLTLDSYQESHPLTGQPVISYLKARSASKSRTIDRELHIPTLEVEEFFIEGKIQEDIHSLIHLVIELTKTIRHLADDEIKGKLFIFENTSTEKRESGKICSLDNQILVTGWLNSFPKKNKLFDMEGKTIIFNTLKFRPTLVSKMINQGADIFQVSVVLGHGSIITTARYLSEHRLQPKFNEKMSKAIDSISKRSIEQKSTTPYTDVNQSNLEPIKTLSGCSCKDPYSPSSKVKEATNYKEGSLCKYWNMCLLCDSSFITESGLPKLINYQLELQESLDKNSPSVLPRKKLVESTIALIDGILQPDEIFSESVIANAHVLACELDNLEIDQLVYQGF